MQHPYRYIANTLACGFMQTLRIACIASIIFASNLFAGVGVSQPAHAQATDEGPWTPAVNLSRSGSASQPLVALGPDGTTHTLWWDKLDGMRYNRVSASALTSTTVVIKPVPVPTIFGNKQIDVDQKTGRSTTTLSAPANPRLLADTNGRAHFLWQNALNQLLYSQGPGPAQGQTWSAPQALSEAMIAADATADSAGGLHLAYVRSSDGRTRTEPGLYYRARAGNAWAQPTLVYSSTYFRVDTANDVAASVAGDGKGNAIVTWFQARLGQSFYAVSNNKGKTWSAPLPVSGATESSAAQTSVTSAPDGAFLLIWRDANARGCGLTQRKSMDAGLTWSNPEPILGSLGNCPPTWQFATSEGKLWFVGAPRDAQGFNANSVTLANWDGTQWSATVDLALTAFDAAAKRAQTLSCLNVGLAGASLIGMGCSSVGDVWLSANAVPLSSLISSLQVSWTPAQLVSEQQGNVAANTLATATDGQSVLYAMWAQPSLGNPANVDIYFANWTNDLWTKTRVIGPPSGRASHPSLAFTPDGRVHALWNSGKVYYSKSFARDANNAEGWSKPQPLDAPNDVAGASSLIYDPRTNTLLAAFSVPFNENRGIYLTRSTDGGDKWAAPQLVFDAVSAGWESADQPQLTLDPVNGILHLVWLKTVLPNNTGQKGVYYASSRDEGATWSAPVELATGNVDVPQLTVAGKGLVSMVWNRVIDGSTTATPYEAHYRVSPDDGQRWSDDQLVSGFEEVSGRLSVVGDQAGHLYAVGVSQTPGGESSLLYSYWTGQTWAAREVFALGQAAGAGSDTAAILLPQTGQLTALMRIPMLNRDGVNQFEVVSIERKVTPVELDPAIALPPAPTPAATSATQLQIEASPTPKPMLALTPAPTNGSGIGAGTQREVLLFGALAVVIVLGIGGIVFGFSRSRRR